jgi:pSer/pThr/pTyr-binding forkhead associated (FHA) protein
MANQERTVMFQMPSVLAGNLACVEGSVKGRSFELTAGTFVIGRADSSDLHLANEPGVSKTHAKIIAEGDGYVLVDCESRNGTIVNGAPVQRKALEDGDEIRVCGCVLRFSQRGATATGIKVRNVDSRRSVEPIDASQEDVPIDLTDPGGDAVPATAMSPISQPSVSSSAPSMGHPSLLRTELEIPTFASPSDSALAAGTMPPPSPGKTLVVWYAGGLLSALLFGGSASAVIVGTAKPEVVAATDAPATDAAVASGDGGPVVADATQPTPTDPAATPPAATPPTEVNDDGTAAALAKAEADKAATEKAAAEKAEQDKALLAKAEAEKAEAEKAEAAKVEVDKAAESKTAVASRDRRSARREREREAAPAEPDASAAEASDAPAGKQFAATPESGRTDTLKARGGKVKTVEAKDGDTVSKGQVLVTFEEGASESEIMSLKDRIATLEAVDSEEARGDLKAARSKLEALTSGAKSPPVVASMSGTLSGFTVSAGETLRGNATVGRISEGGTPKRVRVRIDRGTRASRGQSVTLLTKAGERTGSVASVSGRTVVVDTGDTSATDVDAVRF